VGTAGAFANWISSYCTIWIRLPDGSLKAQSMVGLGRDAGAIRSSPASGPTSTVNGSVESIAAVSDSSTATRCVVPAGGGGSCLSARAVARDRSDRVSAFVDTKHPSFVSPPIVSRSPFQPSSPRMSSAVSPPVNRSPSSRTPLKSSALRRASAATRSSIVSRAIMR